MNLRNTKFYKSLSPYLATALAEGFCEGATKEEQLCAWQYLVDNKICWNLQGWFGRTANSLLKAGYIKKPRKTYTKKPVKTI